MHRGGDGAALHLRSSGRIAPAGPPPTRALSVTAAFASHLRGQGGEGTYPLPVVFRQKKRRHFWDFFDGDLRRRLRRGQGGYSRGGGGVGGSMGLAMCAVYPSGPVSREIRLRWWCLPIIINDPNFMFHVCPSAPTKTLWAWRYVGHRGDERY